MTELSKYAILYMPETDTPTAVVNLIHGMGEYQGRYKAFAHHLNQYGYAVITSDLKGHGINNSRNTELGFFGDNAVRRLTGDIHEISLYVKQSFPGIPYIIMGHGIGALLCVIYFKKYDNLADGLFLSGMPADHRLRAAGELLVTLLITLKGEYHRSRLMESLVLGPLERPFRREGSIHSWLSSDIESTRKYENDAKCGFTYTLNGFSSILEMMKAVYSTGSWIRKNPSCPIRLFAGEDDPCIAGKNRFQKTVHLFTDAGYTNVDVILYPNERHELFQDFVREPMCSDILRELEDICIEQPLPQEEPAQAPVHIVLDDFIDPEVEKPIEKTERLNLEDFIHTREGNSSDHRPKVEMIDFKEIDSLSDEARNMSEVEDPDDLSEILDEIIRESENTFSVRDVQEEDPEDV